MPQPCLRIAKLALTIALIAAVGGLSACKYTGGDTEQSADEQPADGQQANAPNDPQKEQQDQKKAQQNQQELQPQRPVLGEGSRAQQELMTRAKKAFLNNDVQRAEELFSELAETRPISGPQVSGVIALAQIYNESERPEKALELYEGLEEHVEDVPEVQLVIARALAEQGETERAIEVYEKVLEIQPDFVFAHVELAELHGELGDQEKASKALYRYETRVYKMAETLESPKTSAADRINILDVFSLVNDDRAIAAVVEVLSADEPAVRQKAATVLGEIGAPEAKEPLRLLIAREEHPGVRTAAQEAVDEIDALGAPDADGKGDGEAQIGPKVVDDKDELPE